MPELIVIVGPTASGKTALSIKLAQELDAEIISADSRQFYRQMDIGTAKPTTEEQQAAKHHFIDTLNPDEDYNAGQYEEDAITFLDDYFQEKNTAILVGGSGLYINAVLYGFDQLPKTTPELREKWNERFESEGLQALQNELKERDPEYAQQVDLSNRQRVQRALEAMDSTNRPFSELRTSLRKTRNFNARLILLEPDRQELYQLINDRVDQMMENGLLEEVRSLLSYRDCNALKTVGYKELIQHLNGELTLEDAIDKIKQHTRNYAKRQYTWFRAQDGYQSFPNNNHIPVLKHLSGENHV